MHPAPLGYPSASSFVPQGRRYRAWVMMSAMRSVWGIQNDHFGSELVEGGFVSIGWDDLGDLRAIGLEREALKAAFARAYPDDKPRAIAGRAGILLRFGAEIAEGDVIVAPYRPDSTINIGIVTGPYEFHADAPAHRHRRRVRWEKLGVSRTVFSQPALYEIGSLLTVIGIRKNAEEFLAVLAATDEAAYESVATDASGGVEVRDELTEEEPRASRIDRQTRDFVLERLQRPHLTDQEFEEFTADLLRALGYQARVTQFSQDGGVDVIAHRDPLGVEPPLIKVQCKHQTGTIGSPEVQQLVGTQAATELGLFVTLGSYSKDARAIERTRQGLRLLSGEDPVDLVLQTYAELPPRWRRRVPLTPLLVVDDSADS